MPDGTRFGDSFISQDIQLSYVLKLQGRLRIEATAQMFNAFNVLEPGRPRGPAVLTLRRHPAHAGDAAGGLRGGQRWQRA